MISTTVLPALTVILIHAVVQLFRVPKGASLLIWSERVSFLFLPLSLLNFCVFLIVQASAHGPALFGGIDNGSYYVEDRGRHTAVGEAHFRIQYVYEVSSVVLFLCGFVMVPIIHGVVKACFTKRRSQ